MDVFVANIQDYDKSMGSNLENDGLDKTATDVLNERYVVPFAEVWLITVAVDYMCLSPPL